MNAADVILAGLERPPDAHVIAQAIADGAQRNRRSSPPAAELAEAITSLTPESHLQGASALQITLLDPTWKLLDSDLLAPGPDGKTLAPIEINYPDGSRFWWRLKTASPKADHYITLTWADRVAVDLMQLRGPLKAARSRKTRAEFLKMIVSRAKGAEFFCEQLHIKEPVEPVQHQPVSSNQSPSGAKASGVGANSSGLTVKGAPITREQVTTANGLLSVAARLHASEAATVALVYAATWESGLGAARAFNSQGYGGVLGGSQKVFASTDDEAMATCFLQGGKGFQGGGALSLSRTVTNPVEIAIRVELPSVWPQNAYAQQSGYPGDQAAVAEARAIVQAGGGAASGGDLGPGTTTETVQEYNFEIGTTSDPQESLWDGAVRLAQEVNWPFFTDGDRVYYDSEMTLIKQKPAAVIDRDDEVIADWNYDWDVRGVLTGMTLFLFCDPFQFRAGEVLVLQRFGTASVGSTAKLPGRWLISDVTRPPGLVSQLTLKQPTDPKREPAPQVTTTTTQTGGPASDLTVPADVKSLWDSASTQVPGHPELKPNISKAVNIILAQFPALHITSTISGTHASGSYHYFGQAADLSDGPGSSALKDQAGRWIQQTLAPYLVEGIHNPTLSVKNGQVVSPGLWGATTWGQHLDHIHVAAV